MMGLGAMLRTAKGCVNSASLSREVISKFTRKHRIGLVQAVQASSTIAADSQRVIRPFQKRLRVATIKGNDQGRSSIGQEVEVKGWVRTLRDQKTFTFVEINDGSTLDGLQVVISEDVDGFALVSGGQIQTGCSIKASGSIVASPGGKQAVELKATKLELVGFCDPADYPLQKKRHTLEFLRGIAHLRARTNTIGAAMRVRSALAQATHDFFQGNGFHYVHTPLISASDCEGAGEMFQVTTLLGRLDKASSNGDGTALLQAAVAEQGELVKAAKAKAKGTALEADMVAAKEAVDELLRLKAQLASLEGAQADASIPMTQDGAVDYSKDFFGRRAFLTVSGQLNGEMYACALGDIYTFGPTFRAENSNTSRHLAEFWMIEPELAFADLDDDMACAEAYLKHCVQHILRHCRDDLAFFDKTFENGLLQRLQAIVDKPFATITYTRAVEILLSCGKAFEFPVAWGSDLQSEHERYLTEVAFEGTPLIVTDYPKDIKSFYMRLNDDGKTVAAMDLLVPRVGELMGGSQREDRTDLLLKRMQEVGLNPADYQPYIDLRRFGSVPHAGFGLGFERLVQFCTGVDNIRDVIPFPRYPGHAEF